jgi:hypothetical protein
MIKNVKAGVFIALILLSLCAGKAKAVAADSSAHCYFIGLPLRLTYMQEHPTLLSGIKFGRRFSNRLQLSVAVYHSFYIEKMWPAAGIDTFGQKQPHHFIYSAGLDVEYRLAGSERLSLWSTLYAGWGFMKYQTKAHNFTGSTIHYPALEPALKLEFQTSQLNSIAVGAGYRPFIGATNFTYRSDFGSGAIPVNRQLPNGLIAHIDFRWFF